MLSRFDKLAFVALICLVIVIGVVALSFHIWGGPQNFLSGDDSLPKTLSAGKNGPLTTKGGSESTNGHEEASSPKVRILKRWELPGELAEISAISYLDEQRLACIQDEAGTIYIYNTAHNRIERKLEFGPPGDYEGMTLVNGVAYVVNSSGVIYEVNDIQSAKPVVKVFPTQLSEENNVEGIGWDKGRGKLLLTVKKDRRTGIKGIYAFDPTTGQLLNDPALILDLSDQVFEQGGKKKSRDFQPSSISIHRTLGDIYVLEGANQRLLILDKNGSPQQLVQLDKKDFAQPEGITFSPAGDMFISNEGKTGSGTILKVSLN